MTRPDASRLTGPQLEILREVWDRRECTVTELWEALRERRAIARNTVLTQIQRLEQKGWLARRDSDRGQVYRARVTRRVTQRERLDDLVDHVFDGSAEDVVRSLLGQGRIGAEELARLRRLLADAEADES